MVDCERRFIDGLCNTIFINWTCSEWLSKMKFIISILMNTCDISRWADKSDNVCGLRVLQELIDIFCCWA